MRKIGAPRAQSSIYTRAMSTRVLTEGDRAAAEAFLVVHRDSSMFLRANILRCGFEYTGAPYEATYVGAFEGERLIGVMGHAWNGMLMVQAPAEAESLAVACVAASGREVTGFAGPRDQVHRARAALGLAQAAPSLDGEESLYALDLEDLREPPPPDEEIECRPPSADERDVLLRFRYAYELEVLGSTESDETLGRAAEFLDAQLRAGHVWIAIAGGRIVSLSAFNAALPDIVQLGGIYTPPELRGRGYARHAIAAQLLAARSAGAERAVLFTESSSAVRCYEALGFCKTSEFALVLLR